jgi:peptidylprolyl isomerase
MQHAKPGDTVVVHYTGTLANGKVFDSSEGRDPLEFTLGGGQVIPGFERAVDGMAVGDAKTVTIPADEAYGPRQSELTVTVERSQFPKNMKPAVGQQLQMSRGGQVFVVTVLEVSEERIVLDANHPLAGADLTFKLELVEIR